MNRLSTLSIFVSLVFMLSCCINLVNSAATCFSCAKGSNPVDCFDAYTPSFSIDRNVCQSIRDEIGEVQRLCNKYDGTYLVRCELDDYTEPTCSNTCLQPSRRKSEVYSGNNGQTLRSPVNTLFAITTFCFFFLTL